MFDWFKKRTRKQTKQRAEERGRSKFEQHLEEFRAQQLETHGIETIHNRPYRLDYDNANEVTVYTLVAHLQQFADEDLPNAIRHSDALEFRRTCAEIANLATMLHTRSLDI